MDDLGGGDGGYHSRTPVMNDRYTCNRRRLFFKKLVGFVESKEKKRYKKKGAHKEAYDEVEGL